MRLPGRLLAVLLLGLGLTASAQRNSPTDFRVYRVDEYGLDLESSALLNTSASPVLNLKDPNGFTLELAAGGMVASPMATQAACIAFSVNTTQTTLDVFLTTKRDLASMLSADQEVFDGARAVPIAGASFKGARDAAAIVNVSSAEQYLVAAINTGQTGNGNTTNATVQMSLAAHARGSPVCARATAVALDSTRSSAALGPAAPAPGPSQQPSVLTPVMGDDFLLETVAVTVPALLQNASCVAFQLLRAPDTTHDFNALLYLTTSPLLLGYIGQFLTNQLPEAGNNGSEGAGALPAPVGPRCRASLAAPPAAASGTVQQPGAAATLTSGVSLSRSDLSAIPQTDADGDGSTDDLWVNGTLQDCQVAVDGLQPTATYALVAAMLQPPGNGSATDAAAARLLTPLRMRYAARTRGSCSDVAFPPAAAERSFAAVRRQYEGDGHLVYYSGVNIGQAVPAGAPSPGSGGAALPAGAAAGVAVAAAVGGALLAAAAFLLLRRRRRRRADADAAATKAAGEDGSDAKAGLPLAPLSQQQQQQQQQPHPEAWARLLAAHAAGPGHAHGSTPAHRSGGSSGAAAGSGRQPPVSSSSEGGPVDWEWDPATVVLLPDAATGQPQLLGRGPLGPVFRARVYGTALAAVKRVPACVAAAANTGALRRALAYAATVRHESLVHLDGACFQGEELLLVQELCPGGCLAAARERPDWAAIPQAKKLGMALGAAKGLHYLHFRGVTHGCLHARCVLLSAAGRLKLGGGALWAAGCPPAWRELVRQRPDWQQWQAPEVAAGGEPSPAADVYCLGGVLWEIFAGRPFERQASQRLRCPEDCPGGVRNLILACLSAWPGQRPSAQEIVEALLDQQRLSAAQAVPS